MDQDTTDNEDGSPTETSTGEAVTDDAAAAAWLEKHAEDIERVAILSQDGFEGSRWDALVRDLVEYAWPRLHAKLTTGTIGGVSTGTPHPGLRPDVVDLLRDSVRIRDDLLVNTLQRATEKFRAHLLAGRWKPERGKSLMSYFFGTAAGAFWDEYKIWLRQHDAARKVFDFTALDGFEDLARNHPMASSTDPSLVLAQRHAVRCILANASPEQRLIAGALYEGDTQAVIAAELGMTQGAVTFRMRKLRSYGNTLVQSGMIDPLILPGRQARKHPSMTTSS